MVIDPFSGQIVLGGFDIFVAEKVFDEHDVFGIEDIESEGVAIVSCGESKVFFEEGLERSRGDAVSQFFKILRG